MEQEQFDRLLKELSVFAGKVCLYFLELPGVYYTKHLFAFGLSTDITGYLRLLRANFGLTQVHQVYDCITQDVADELIAVIKKKAQDRRELWTEKIVLTAEPHMYMAAVVLRATAIKLSRSSDSVIEFFGSNTPCDRCGQKLVEIVKSDTRCCVYCC